MSATKYDLPALSNSDRDYLLTRCRKSWPVDFGIVSETACVNFILDLWDGEPREFIKIPKGLEVETANQWASIVLEHRQRTLNTLGKVEIKQVAEIRGSRFNNGKTRYDLLNWESLEGLAKVLEFGATKYSAHNWQKGLPVTEILASLLRHVAAIQNGENIDPETGLPHADHIQCNAMFLSWMMKNRADMYDVHKPDIPPQPIASMETAHADQLIKSTYPGKF